ncbi:hypothetical protein RE628_19540 [Paenibacillus sp. D2_2]|uniref:hypothetical protein n=1 Tax=Paenibacillus sp. D2_2 TaxID=3073092 RepID=UPI00281652DD|nr:hypothetical protein [Paenibacillus sp. D2_2]WMT39581.1 hypothetical protein RE628_19540 [Paenibacillus sp. D2_2]
MRTRKPSILISLAIILAFALLPIGPASPVHAAASIYVEGFEGEGLPALYSLPEPYGTIIESASEAIAGNRSVKGHSEAGAAWAEFMKLDRQVSLTPGTDYVISFKYKVMKPAGEFFYFYMKQPGVNGEVTTGFNFKGDGTIPYRTNLTAEQTRLSEKDGYMLAQADFKASGDGLYKMVWGIQGGGTIIVDDISIQEEHSLLRFRPRRRWCWRDSKADSLPIPHFWLLGVANWSPQMRLRVDTLSAARRPHNRNGMNICSQIRINFGLPLIQFTPLCSSMRSWRKRLRTDISMCWHRWGARRQP